METRLAEDSAIDSSVRNSRKDRKRYLAVFKGNQRGVIVMLLARGTWAGHSVVTLDQFSNDRALAETVRPCPGPQLEETGDRVR